MQFTALSTIVTAKRQGDRSYVLVFAADTGTFELFLPGAGYPGEFTGFMPPSVRNQSTGQSWMAEWSQAEQIAAHLETVLHTAGPASAVAREVIDALATGRRYGGEV
jgi:hypothetical protein